MLSAPVLAYPDPSKEYLFETDASKFGLDAVLSQKQSDGRYDFSFEYQKGKNNTVADALSQIREEHLPDAEAEELLETVPIISGDDTIIRVFEEKEEDKWP